MVPSSNGRIHSMLLVYPGDMEGVTPELVLQHFGGIIKTIGAAVIFYVLANFAREEDQTKFAKGLTGLKDRGGEYADEKRGGKGNYHLVHLQADWHSIKGKPPDLTDYSQDPFSMLIGENGLPGILEPYAFGKKGDRYIAEMVASKLSFVIKPTSLELEGGNILATDNAVFLGSDLLVRNLKHLGLEVGAMVDSMAEITSLPGYAEKLELLESTVKTATGKSYVYWVGLKEKLELEAVSLTRTDGWQPFFHIDLFVTMGKKTADGGQTVYVAEINKPVYPWIIGEPESSTDVEQVKAALDEIANQFEDFNDRSGPRFTVKRIPLAIDFKAMGPKIGVINSYNNCIVEIAGNVNQVFLPAFQPADARKQVRAYRGTVEGMAEMAFKRDFESVKFIYNQFPTVAKGNASLHCISKVLYRIPD